MLKLKTSIESGSQIDLGTIDMLPSMVTTASSALSLLLADRRSAATKRAYESDLRIFFAWQGKAPTPEAVADLCWLDAGALAITLNEYAAYMRSTGLSESASNRRLSAIRSLLKTARRLGAGNPDPSGLVKSETVDSYRDTRGPALIDVRRLLALPDRSTPRGIRDFALLVLLWENGLRRAEVCSCDIEHFDARGLRLYIIGKGRGTQRSPVTLSARAVSAIGDYITDRKSRNPGSTGSTVPLFCTLAHFVHDKSTRLTPNGLYTIIQRYGLAIGLKLHPHAMRHAAITATLDATNGDMRTAKGLSRHKRVETLMRYDDNREDLQGRATALLSALA